MGGETPPLQNSNQRSFYQAIPFFVGPRSVVAPDAGFVVEALRRDGKEFAAGVVVRAEQVSQVVRHSELHFVFARFKIFRYIKLVRGKHESFYVSTVYLYVYGG